MSSRRKFSVEFKVEAAHRVIDSGCPVAQLRRLLVSSRWVAGFVMSELGWKHG